MPAKKRTRKKRKKTTKRRPETALAKQVEQWLIAKGWEVYKEVLAPKHKGKKVCDIYAVKRNNKGDIIDTWAIEVKATFGLTVMEQAYNWRLFANRVSIATPKPKKRPRQFGHKICTSLDIGVLEIGTRSVYEKYTSPRRAKVNLYPTLNKEQKKSVAGTPRGGHWTPFKQTVKELEAIAKKRPGITLQAAINAIDHHYASTSSAMSSIQKHILNGVIDTLEVKWETDKRTRKRNLHLYAR